NFPALRQDLLAKADYHLVRNNDTEVIMHSIAREMSGDERPDLVEMFSKLSEKFDGAYNLVYLNAMGDLAVLRDPLGIRPLCWATDDSLFAAASESVALLNLGFRDIQTLQPGEMAIIQDNRLRIERFARRRSPAHCFFEWVYFANVASTLDGRSVYLSRAALGSELARLETVALDEDTIVVPVPDPSKAAADAMSQRLTEPSRAGLIPQR